MNVLADERVDRPIVERLRRDGYKVEYVADLEPGMDDQSVLELANSARALLLTADKDFGEIVFRQRLHIYGVVLIRLAGLPAAQKAELVSGVFRDHLPEMERAFVVISPGMVRIRRAKDRGNGGSSRLGSATETP